MMEQGHGRHSSVAPVELLDRLPQAIWVTSPDGAVEYGNCAFRTLLGHVVGAAKGSWLGAVHPDDRPKAESLWREVRPDSGVLAVELRLVGHDSTVRPVRVELSPRVGEGGVVEGCLFCAVDTADLTATRAALAELEARYRAFVSGFQGIAYRGTLDFQATFFEGAVEPITGYTASELTCGKLRWDELIHPDDLPGLKDENERLLHTTPGYSYVREYRIVRKDGQVRWLHEIIQSVGESPGTPTSVHGALYDITAQKAAEQALRESEERLRLLIDHAILGIYRATPGGRLLMANPALARLIGCDSVEDLEPQNLNELAKRIGYPRQELMRRLEIEGEVAGFETSWTRLDGQTIHVRENARAVRDGEGHVVCYEGTIEDLTSHTQLEEQLRRAQKMEAIGRLAGGVAHGFNNVMQAMLSLTAVLRSLRDNPERHEEVLVELEDQVTRGSTLTRQLLLFSRRDVARLEPLDLNEVIRASAALLNRIVRENIRFSVSLDPRPLPVFVDHGQLDQVLLNLVLNAAEAMPDGGELTISSGLTESSEAWFEVSDQGCGIADDVRERIFEPFFTTKAEDGATGLGLAVTHGIVTTLKGAIEMRSTVGKGSAFRVVLPLAARPARPEVSSLAAAFRGVEGKGELVLLVEDEPGARQGLRDVLEMLGYRVKVAADAEEALALPTSPGFDVLLSDILLPGAHGAELARRLQERWPRLRVILMSGYAEDEALQRGISEGRVRFLAKPFTMVTLARELRVALAER